VDLWLKYEGLNPTGSFKDRGMTMAISKAAEAGSKVVMCASTGNTSASAAAYAARAGMRCIVLLPKGAIALGKLSQALMHGARVVAVEGNFDDALELVKQITRDHPITLVNSINPFRIEGQKTGSFEIVEQLGGKAPDFHAIPVGNAGNITAYWKGFREARAHRLAKGLPVMLGFQAAGSAPIVKGRPIKDPHTLATAIKIGNPASWKPAVAARDESKGLIDSVTDKQILEAYGLLARLEGVFCEPASAASVAGVLALGRKGFFKKQAAKLGKRRLTVTCVLTGHGLKDPDRAVAQSPRPEVVKADMRSLVKLLKL
jgi:threonine synthase